jgi:hypothetical protein
VTLLAWRRWWSREGLPALRLMALESWDPIGVYGEPEAVDEYDSYLVRVGRMLRSGAGAPDIARYLTQVRTKAMRLDDSPLADEAFAEEVVAWYSLEAPR